MFGLLIARGNIVVKWDNCSELHVSRHSFAKYYPEMVGRPNFFFTKSMFSLYLNTVVWNSHAKRFLDIVGPNDLRAPIACGRVSMLPQEIKNGFFRNFAYTLVWLCFKVFALILRIWLMSDVFVDAITQFIKYTQQTCWVSCNMAWSWLVLLICYINLQCAGTKLSRFNWVIIMVADTLAQCISRPSAAMISVM